MRILGRKKGLKLGFSQKTASNFDIKGETSNMSGWLQTKLSFSIVFGTNWMNPRDLSATKWPF